MQPASRRSPRFAVVALTVATLAAPFAAGEAPTTAPATYAILLGDPATEGTLRRLLDEARERLSQPACQRVLDDFTAADGRSLRSHLQDVGGSPEAYLELVVFRDGRQQARCREKGTLAVATVGGRLVYVCPEALRTRARRHPAWAEAVLIHEALHTLGLGENPPTSQEITAQVLRRCGR